MGDTPSTESQIGPYRQSIAKVLSGLDNDPDNSLDEYKGRLREGGGNVLGSKPPVPGWKLFLGQFTDVLVMLLIAAAAVSAVVLSG